jgi:hypothetical protein
MNSGGFFDDWENLDFGRIDNNLNIYRIDPTTYKKS